MYPLQARDGFVFRGMEGGNLNALEASAMNRDLVVHEKRGNVEKGVGY